jgi:hypothetical protein
MPPAITLCAPSELGRLKRYQRAQHLASHDACAPYHRQPRQSSSRSTLRIWNIRVTLASYSASRLFPTSSARSWRKMPPQQKMALENKVMADCKLGMGPQP